jgi:hypothetical protein
MKKLTKLRIKQFWRRPTWEDLYIVSTLVVPLMLVIFFSIESVLVLVSFALFLLTITFLDMKKDRDYWKRSWELCKDLLEKEREIIKNSHK